MQKTGQTEPITAFDRVKYFASAAGSVGLATGLLGAGTSGGAILGVAAGIGAALFSSEIRGMMIDHIPAPDGTTSRRNKLAWLLTGEVETAPEEVPPQDTPEPAQAEETTPESHLPLRSPAFPAMRHLITPDHDILGFDGSQFIVADALKQSVNIALIGVPHSGKTSCLTFHVGQAILRNAIIRGWDLHGDVAADLGDCFNILEDVDDIVADCRRIQAIRDQRTALRKRAKAKDAAALWQWENTREIFYIVDEFNALMLRLKRRKADRDLVADTLLSLVAEGRKFKMRVVLAGQTMPAALFGDGGSSARDIINTKYAFRSRDEQARYFGIEHQAIETLLPSISGEEFAGYAILDGGPLLHAILVSIPYTTVDDIRALAEQYQHDDDEFASEENNAQPGPTDEPQAPVVIGRVSGGVVWQRQRAREQRLRESQVRSQEEKHIPTLQEVKDAFPEKKPSKRDIQKRFDLTDYQAYELYKQLTPKAVG